jgi:hypothetical protein
LSKFVKTEDDVHDYVKGKSSFEGKIGLLSEKEKLRVVRGRTEDGT